MSSTLYDKFEMPTSIKVDEKTASNTNATFIVEPFERGFGHTMGNALRRMLLTSIESPAIVSFFIEGVQHEYMAVEGVSEDITDIALNLKSSLLRKLPSSDEPNSHQIKSLNSILNITEDDLKEKGYKIVTLGDIVNDGQFEVVNPDLHIFTATKPMMKRVEVKVMFGRGYVPSERHQLEHKSVDEIVIDTSFSPVRLVNYYVEDTRVGRDTDFDRLVLEVKTDGRVTPQEAVTFSSLILSKHLNVFETLEEHEISFEEPVVEADNDLDDLMKKLVLGINEIELSVRSTNCLNGAMIDTIGELVVMPEPKLLQFRNFGKKSLNEIKAKLTEMGLGLGMDLSRFGITQDNVKEVIKDYFAEQEDK